MAVPGAGDGAGGGGAVSRFLFVVPPLAGHVYPAAAVAAALTAWGHRVAWAGHRETLAALLGGGAEVFACEGPAGLGERPPGLRGVAALRFLWDDFLCPLAEAMAPGVEAAVRSFGPGLVVADQQAVAGALVAERLGVRFATSCTTATELADGLRGLPKVGQWLAGRLAALRERIGDPAATHDPRFSPWLTVAFSTRELTGGLGEAAGGGGPVRLVGPALGGRAERTEFPWEWVRRQGPPLVLVTLGTVNAAAGARFLRACLAAVRARAGRVRAVFADPGGVLPAVPAADPDVLVRPVVPQLDLLRHASAVVCHAGHNTVVEALWHAVPLLVAPIRDDQPLVAEQVTAAGAGLRVRFARAGGEEIGAALDALLTEERFRAAARRVSGSFRAAGGAPAAAEALAELAAAGPDAVSAAAAPDGRGA
ncbi:glycosyltransferase [Streptomyces sp. 7-21]|uniref:glycosyltransferase n=1 Tax=Streptomyces sp. 7-21 TaxID=2802283 RepID=UPI001F1EA893